MAAAAPMSAPVSAHKPGKTYFEDAAPGKVSRWSDLHISKPAYVLAPEDEADVITAIRLARAKHLTIVVGGGGHGTFLPVDSSTLYLNMKAFQDVEVDPEAGLVRIGGGASTCEVLNRLTEKGLYTTLCDSNTVGAVGSLLGAGNSPHVGINGYMVDNAVSFRLITADEKLVDVDVSSSGEKLALFNALCGAGQGHGVVLSVTMKTYPLSALGLTDNKIWTRVMAFEAAHLDVAIKAYLSLQPAPGALYTQLVYNRGPPGSSMAGRPIIILSAMYLGAAEDAERATASLVAADVSAAAAQADTQMININSINNALEPLNVHGGLKSTNGARLTKINEKMMTAAFAKWVAITDALPDAHRSLVSFQSFNPAVLQANGVSKPGRDMFLEARDRGSIMVVATWCATEESHAKLQPYADDVLRVCREEDGAPPRTIPNTMRYKEPLENLFTRQRISELQRLKQCWDPRGLFWSPYVGKYRDSEQ